MIKRVLLVLLCLGLMATGAHGKEKKTYAMSLKVFKAVEEINLMVDEGREADALLELAETLDMPRLSKYEKAQLWYLRGTIFYKTEGEAAALENFSRVLEFDDGIPVFLHLRVLTTLVQLNLVLENFAQARDHAERLISVSEQPKADDYALLAQANYRLEDWAAALEACLQARAVYESANLVPKENILLLQNAVYFELKDMENMVNTLEILIKHYPKSTYVLYLASIYGQLDRLDKQTVLMESLYEDGKLTDSSQLVNLASLYLSEKVPYKAAVLLEDSIEQGVIEETQRNYEMLSQAWRLAAELQPSVMALAKAAELADDGVLYVRKAYIHYDMAQWQEAEQAVYKALDKGLDEKHKGEAWLLMGMTRFNMNAFEKAITACERAASFPESKSLAQRWITYISNEQDKYNTMRGLN
ncbi:tetratricopeptide repeat protein [Aestuariibacter salexigens]|uniref:tetratricopeptide repeat protein n=1 Tax=Aestuariibacter salexigens TaxID=226010 RepID=UPI0004094988|nr:tetratricopeptide repeat protein [Aestuariibacter salexigens]